MSRTRINRIRRKSSKYQNIKLVTESGEKFDSKGEYDRWRVLQIMQKSGAITDLKRQVVFVLIPSVMIGGRRKPTIRYVADYCYVMDGKKIVEDYKGMITSMYRIKKHLMKHVHDIDIFETYSSAKGK